MRRIALLLLAWPLLASVAPLQPVAPCLESAAIVVRRADVVDDAGRPIGRATAWSCLSDGEAQAELARNVALVRLQHACWYGGRTDGCAAAPMPPEVWNALHGH